MILYLKNTESKPLQHNIDKLLLNNNVHLFFNIFMKKTAISFFYYWFWHNFDYILSICDNILGELILCESTYWKVVGKLNFELQESKYLKTWSYGWYCPKVEWLLYTNILSCIFPNLIPQNHVSLIFYDIINEITYLENTLSDLKTMYTKIEPT